MAAAPLSIIDGRRLGNFLVLARLNGLGPSRAGENGRVSACVTLNVHPLKEFFSMYQSLLVRAGLLCLALTSIGSIASAQTKVAVINLQRAVLESNEIKKASTALEGKYKPRQQEL